MSRRRWLVSGVLIAVAASAGTACTDAREPAADVSSSSVAPSESPSEASSVVPGAALLQPADLRGARPERPEPDWVPYLRPPRPCADGGPSDAVRLAAAAVRIIYSIPASSGNPEYPTVLLELVMRFGDDGAAQYMAELRDEVARCRSGSDGRQWTAKDGGIADESLLVTVSQPTQLPESSSRQSFPVLVARTGHAVVVLADLGWEFDSGDEKLILQLAPKAVERARNST